VVLRAPSIYSSTLVTELAASLAVAVILTEPGAEMVEPPVGAVTETVGGAVSVVKLPPAVDANDGRMFVLVVELTKAVPVVNGTLAVPPVVVVVKLRVATNWSPLRAGLPPLTPRAILMTPLAPVDWAVTPKAVPVVLMLVKVNKLVL